MYVNLTQIQSGTGELGGIEYLKLVFSQILKCAHMPVFCWPGHIYRPQTFGGKFLKINLNNGLREDKVLGIDIKYV